MKKLSENSRIWDTLHDRTDLDSLKLSVSWKANLTKVAGDYSRLKETGDVTTQM